MAEDVTSEASLIKLGPLQTVYTPPAHCCSPSIYSSPRVTSGVAFGVTGYWSKSVYSTFTLFVAHEFSNPLCWPSSSPTYELSSGRSTWYSIYKVPYYSPGLNCPSGYTSACNLTKTNSEVTDENGSTSILGNWGALPAGSRLWSQLSDHQTAINCCLSSYQCHPDFIRQCVYIALSGDVITGFTLPWTSYAQLTSYDNMATPSWTSTPTTITITEAGQFAAGIASGVILVRSPKDPEFGTVVVYHSPWSRLSSGARGGTIAGIVLFILIVIGISIYAIKRHRAHRRRCDQQLSHRPDMNKTDPVLPPGMSDKPELQGTPGQPGSAPVHPSQELEPGWYGVMRPVTTSPRPVPKNEIGVHDQELASREIYEMDNEYSHHGYYGNFEPANKGHEPQLSLRTI